MLKEVSSDVKTESLQNSLWGIESPEVSLGTDLQGLDKS